MKNVILRGWSDVERSLLENDKGTVMSVKKGFLPHPYTYGMATAVGLPEGQRADFRKVLEGGAGLHVRDFGDRYEVHIDEVHPDVDPIEHARKDAPGLFIGGGASLGALVGGLLGRSKSSTLAGAAIGGLLAAILTAIDDDE